MQKILMDYCREKILFINKKSTHNSLKIIHFF